LRALNKCLIAATCRSVSADEATCRRDVSQGFVALCVSAFMVEKQHSEKKIKIYAKRENGELQVIVEC